MLLDRKISIYQRKDLKKMTIKDNQFIGKNKVFVKEKKKKEILKRREKIRCLL